MRMIAGNRFILNRVASSLWWLQKVKTGAIKVNEKTLPRIQEWEHFVETHAYSSAQDLRHEYAATPTPELQDDRRRLKEARAMWKARRQEAAQLAEAPDAPRELAAEVVTAEIAMLEGDMQIDLINEELKRRKPPRQNLPRRA